MRNKPVSSDMLIEAAARIFRQGSRFGLDAGCEIHAWVRDNIGPHAATDENIDAIYGAARRCFVYHARAIGGAA
jgi:hypothetical protein